jgi:hypothetical protein
VTRLSQKRSQAEPLCHRPAQQHRLLCGRRYAKLTCCHAATPSLTPVSASCCVQGVGSALTKIMARLELKMAAMRSLSLSSVPNVVAPASALWALPSIMSVSAQDGAVGTAAATASGAPGTAAACEPDPTAAQPVQLSPPAADETLPAAAASAEGAGALPSAAGAAPPDVVSPGQARKQQLRLLQQQAQQQRQQEQAATAAMMAAAGHEQHPVTNALALFVDGFQGGARQQEQQQQRLLQQNSTPRPVAAAVAAARRAQQQGKAKDSGVWGL